MRTTKIKNLNEIFLSHIATARPFFISAINAKTGNWYRSNKSLECYYDLSKIFVNSSKSFYHSSKK